VTPAEALLEPDGWMHADPAAPWSDLPAENPPTDAEPIAAVGHDPGSRPGRLARVGARWLPAGWRGARLDPGRWGAVALVLVAAVAAVIAAVGVWRARPQPEPIPALPAVSLADPSAAATAATTAPGPPAELVVAVSGRVAHPGLVRVREGARVADVLEAAGGPLAGVDLTTLNLARRVADGEQVAVGVRPAPDAATAGPSGTGASGTAGSSGSGAAGGGGKVDLNRATLPQLDGLPGVGPVTAQRILDWRGAHGRFARVDQLREVDGIGERRFAQLKDLVTV
jgi:competence protein ComEA